MFKFKRLTAIAVAVVTAATLFVGCSMNQVNTVRLSTPEEVVQKFNEYNLSNNSDEMAKLYSDAYVSSTGYNLSTVQKILKQNRKDLKITKSELVKIEDYSDTIKKATVTITGTANDKETTNDYVYALIKEANGWSLSPDGLINTTDYPVSTYKKKELNVTLAKKIDLFEGGIIRVNVFNDSKTEYSFGSDTEKCDVEIVTDKGTFNVTMDDKAKVSKDDNTYFMSRNNDLAGEIQKVTIKNVFEYDSNGNIAEDTKKDLVIYEK